jgi:hypothetical protein
MPVFGSRRSSAKLRVAEKLQADCLQVQLLSSLLHMQLLPKSDVAAILARLEAAAMPGRRGFDSWRTLLRAHATLMRRLETDLEEKTGWPWPTSTCLACWLTPVVRCASTRYVIHSGSCLTLCD